MANRWTKHAAAPPVVHSVTNASVPRSQDQAHRQRRYLLAMSIRFVCFVLAIVLPFSVFTWLLLAGAVVLPYIAVILANATWGRPTGEGPLPPGLAPTRPSPEFPSLATPLTHPVPLRRPTDTPDQDIRAGGPASQPASDEHPVTFD